MSKFCCTPSSKTFRKIIFCQNLGEPEWVKIVNQNRQNRNGLKPETNYLILLQSCSQIKDSFGL